MVPSKTVDVRGGNYQPVKPDVLLVLRAIFRQLRKDMEQRNQRTSDALKNAEEALEAAR